MNLKWYDKDLLNSDIWEDMRERIRAGDSVVAVAVAVVVVVAERQTARLGLTAGIHLLFQDMSHHVNQ